MFAECRTHRRDKKKNAYVVSGGKRQLGRRSCKWEDNIKMDLREIGCDNVDWIYLAQSSVQ
jgi:hypothetical protein